MKCCIEAFHRETGGVHKILLVDDDDALAKTLKDALTHFGYEVVRAGNGKEALQLYDPLTIHLVLTDLFMPDMDGMELIMKLEELNPGVRIIAMSGGGMGTPGVHLPLAERLGAVKTLIKPFPMATLHAAVRECLDTP